MTRKTIIRLTESDIHDIVFEAVREAVKQKFGYSATSTDGKKIVKESKDNKESNDKVVHIIKDFFSNEKNIQKAKEDLEKDGTNNGGIFCGTSDGGFSLFFKKTGDDVVFTEIEDAEVHTDGICDSCDLDMPYINDKCKSILNKLR